jgi:HEAT repeat protein
VTTAFIEALHDRDERVRFEAVVGLSLTAREKDAATVSAILNSLRDKSPEVRFFAITTLASDSSMAMKALPEFRKAALDKDQRVREAAVEALSKFGKDANTSPK